MHDATEYDASLLALYVVGICVLVATVVWISTQTKPGGMLHTPVAPAPGAAAEQVDAAEVVRRYGRPHTHTVCHHYEFVGKWCL
jgi:hypothetical protein